MPNQGFKVVELNESVFQELAESILVLLSGCYDHLFCSGKTPALISLLAERLQTQRSFPEKKASFEYAVCSIDFDRAFVDLCGNSMLSKMFDSKFNLLVLCTMQIYAEHPGNITENLLQHTGIYTAVAAGQHEQVHLLLTAHFDKHKPGS